ncbi:hypothetical protein H5410_038909 [Solanum commersonii]|uniref:Uncharacterized protein n=1 Tax=Solanum commersonii TaxID=4109 RepID=A0A9J5YC28_SOLCO|nr:hypothetical protein H5410_038909 [Solanum commersonii]
MALKAAGRFWVSFGKERKVGRVLGHIGVGCWSWELNWNKGNWAKIGLGWLRKEWVGLSGSFWYAEDQIKTVVYGDDIPRYQGRIKLYRTYYIAGSRMQPSSSKYEKPLHAFELVFDRRTVMVSVEENDVDVLPHPTKLTLTSFPDIKQQILRATTDLNRQEFDFALHQIVNFILKFTKKTP